MCYRLPPVKLINWPPLIEIITYYSVFFSEFSWNSFYFAQFSISISSTHFKLNAWFCSHSMDSSEKKWESRSFAYTHRQLFSFFNWMQFFSISFSFPFPNYDLMERRWIMMIADAAILSVWFCIFFFCFAHHVKESFCGVFIHIRSQEKRFHKPEMIRRWANEMVCI